MLKRVIHIIRGNMTIDGAGVRLYRVFGGIEMAELLDPFLLLDHFGSRNPQDYIAGFPWHPHRGIETVTYLLKGEIHHEDSTGNKGVLRPGDIQWMTAGSGIFHEEMPKPLRVRIGNEITEDPEVDGFQLWVNMPSNHKMDTPKYRNLVGKHVPVVTTDEGSTVRIIAGNVRAPGFGVVEGPIDDLVVPVVYLDVEVPSNAEFTYWVKDGFTTIIYMISGEASFGGGSRAVSRELVVYSREGEEVKVRAGDGGARFLLLSGKPIGEPIAWYGPIVMNTWDEIAKALEELRMGTFVKHGAIVRDY